MGRPKGAVHEWVKAHGCGKPTWICKRCRARKIESTPRSYTLIGGERLVGSQPKCIAVREQF